MWGLAPPLRARRAISNAAFHHTRMFSRLRKIVVDRSCPNAFTFVRHAGRSTSRRMLSSTVPFEEEREMGFEHFYLMTLREVINGKYEILAKLDLRSASTLWCCQNLA